MINTLTEIGKVFLIPLQALNLIILATIYYESPLIPEMLGKENYEIQKSFKLWILIELLVMIAIVGSNIIFLMIRSCFRQQLDFILSDDPDEHTDFIASAENQFVLDIFNQTVTPIVISTFIRRTKMSELAIDPIEMQFNKI